MQHDQYYDPNLHRPLRRGRQGWAGIVGLVLTLGGVRTAAAAGCPSAGQLSPCIVADPLWPAPGSERFLSTGATVPGERALRLGTTLLSLSRPVVLSAPSPDPAGREIAVVEHALSLEWSLAWGLGEIAELTVAAPMVLRQAGGGLGAVASQAGMGLSRAAVRDARVGGGLQLWAAPALRAKVRFEVLVPSGDASQFAGERTAVGAPSVAVEIGRGRVFAGAEGGARLRGSTRLGSSRMGTQLASAVGLGADLLADRRLTLLTESWWLPVLASQPSGRPLIPAEWLVSLGSSWNRDGRWTAQVGGGGAVPLAIGDHLHHARAALSTPAWRLAAVLRYAGGKQ